MRTLASTIPPSARRGRRRPRGSLVAVVAVDQLPPELLERYDALFTGGLRRLRDEGFRFERGSHEHAGTYTAAGHFTLRWVVAFSSDHGVLEVPKILAEQGIEAKRLTRDERTAMFERTRRGIAAAEGGDVGPTVRRELSDLPFVAGVYSFNEIERGQGPDSFAVLYRRSHARLPVLLRPTPALGR